jgi:3-oxoacyl-[acyl-carrier protein] reductase
MSVSNPRVLVFGASGAIGKEISRKFIAEGYAVTAISRGHDTVVRSNPDLNWLVWDPMQGGDLFPSAIEGIKFDAIVWAQGANFSDDIYSFDIKSHEAMYAANVSYILISLQLLLRSNLLAKSGRLCIISSIWQNLARQNKLSYCVTKSALQGLVKSLIIELGRSGHLLNAVLPGALDTPMTRANLSAEQVGRIEAATPLGSLPELNDVSQLVFFLCSKENTGITGQFIAADKGFSYARLV